MVAEIRGCVPKLPISYCPTLINRAWKTVREANLWSFNLFESAWITPPPVTTGTATFIQGSQIVTMDSTAAAALNSASTTYSLITQRQFRGGNIAGVSGIYNIISWDAISTLTLDRIYADPGGTGAAYTIFQSYYTPPMQDFLTWKSVRNMQMFLDLGLDLTRAEVDQRDPQRSWYQFPTEVVFFETDNRGAGTINSSSTLGYPMFELWGVAVTPFTYQCYGIRKGSNLVNPTDTLPDAVGEDVVLAKARMYAYEWAEANKGIAPRAVGPDFRFLMGVAAEEYKKRLVEYRKNDKERVDNWMSARGLVWGTRAFGHYNTVAGTAGPYGY
jgi:hypothetical protein